MSKLPSLATVLFAALLATGCCCPMPAGRFGPAGCCPPCPPPSCGCHGDPCVRHAGRCPSGHCDQKGIRGFAGGRGPIGPVPSNQAADYAAPLPKFHPIPTRPAFEPVAAYSQPTQLEWPTPANARSHRNPHFR